MDLTSISSISTAVASIIQAFSEASRLLEKWRKSRQGKKATGQEELDASLYDGKTSIGAKFRRLSLRHGSRFDIGDRQSLESLIKTRTDFQNALIDVFTGYMTGKGGEKVSINPIALRLVSEQTRKHTLETMDGLSQQLLIEVDIPRPPVFKATEPGYTLPPMPLRETKGSNQTPVAIPHVSIHQRDDQNTSLPVRKLRASEERDILSSSQAMIRRRPSESALARFFSTKPRSRNLLSPHPPSPAVVPSYKCTEQASDILEEGQEFVATLWAAATTQDSLLANQLQPYPHSAPLLLQAPWDMFSEDKTRSSTPPPTRALTPPSPEELIPSTSSSNIPRETGRLSLQSGKRTHSEPVLTFSKPIPRFKRNISGPPGPS